MATLHSVQSGDFTTATTWGLVNATSAVLTYTSQGFPGTTPTASPTFTPGVITVQGISIHISNRSTSAIGTITVELFNATTATVVASVTINATDLFNNNGSTVNPLGWVYFKFGTPVTTVATQLYSVRLTNSSGNQVSVNFLTTAQNWTKVLVTTTNQAPAATDVLIISGQHTAVGTSSTYSVIMNNTSNATAYGNLFVSSKGTLIYGTASSTNYSLRLAGNLLVQYSGTLEIGSVTNPIPATSTATLEILCTTALQFTIVVLGTMTTYGTPKTIATKLASDVIVGAITSTTTTTTNWSNGDLIIVPSTTRTYTQYELKTLSDTASSTTLTHNAYTNAHGGNSTTRVQADVVNLTRNVIIRSATGTLLTNKTNIQMREPCITSFFYTAFLALGTGTTNTNSGICVNTLTTGTFNFQYNVVREIVTQAATTTANTALQTNNTATGITISNNVFYLLGWTTTVTSTVIAAINDNNYFMGCLATTQVLNASIAGSDNVFTSNNTPALIVTFYNNASNNSFYSNNTNGLSIFLSSNSVNLYNFRFWRNGSVGIAFNQGTSLNRDPILSFNDCYFFGNVGNSFSFVASIRAKIYFNNSFFYGGTTLVQPNHYLNFTATTLTTDTVYYNNCYFGYSDTSLTSSPFSGGILSNVSTSLYMLFSSCYFNPVENSTGVITGGTNLFGGFRSINHNGLTGSNREWTQSGGLITTDTTIFLSSSKSTRLTPNSTTFKLVSPLVRVPVKSGDKCTVTVRVRRSVAGDGAQYNGTTTRLMYAFNPVLGNTTETVGHAPFGFTVGAWDTLTYTTATFSSDGVAEFYVDCDGTAGWINIDDWNTTTANDSRGQDYWGVNGVYIEPTYRNPTRASGYIN